MKKMSLIVCFALAMIAFVTVSTFAQTTPAGKKLPRPPRALKGMDIIIGNYWGDWNVDTFKPTTESQEKTLEWRKKVLAENGFKMQEMQVASFAEMPQIAATSIMAKRPAASVFTLQPDWAMSLYKQGMLYPVSKSRQYNPTDKNAIANWNMTVNDVFTFNKETYAMNAEGYGGSLHGAVVFFNKRLFREAGLNENLLYDLQKSGEWTWDKFLEVAKQLTRDIDNDGIIDTYAMTADLSTEILDAFVGGNGAMYVDKDPATGKLVNATNRPEFLEALQFAITVQREGVMKPKPEGINWDWYKAEFNDGRVAMRIEQEYVRNDLANMRDDWGMVVPPKGPRAKDYIIFTDENVMVIPSTFSAAEADAIIWALQAWYAPMDSNWRLALYNTFRDERAVNETMALIRDPKRQQWKYHLHVPGLQRGNIAWEMWFFDGEPAQLVESISSNWNLRIADAN